MPRRPCGLMRPTSRTTRHGATGTVSSPCRPHQRWWEPTWRRPAKAMRCRRCAVGELVGDQRAAPCPAPSRGRVAACPRRASGTVVGSEHVVDDEDLLVVQRADPDRLARAGRQRIGPVERAGTKLVAVEIARTHVQQRRAELVLPALRVLLDEPDALQRAQQPVDRPLRRAPSRRRCPPPRVAGCALTAAGGSLRRARWTECSQAPCVPRRSALPPEAMTRDELDVRTLPVIAEPRA